MEVSGQLHTPTALLPEKRPPVPIWWQDGWAPRTCVDVVEKRKISCPYWESNRDRHPVCCLVTILTELPELQVQTCSGGKKKICFNILKDLHVLSPPWIRKCGFNVIVCVCVCVCMYVCMCPSLASEGLDGDFIHRRLSQHSARWIWML
jgi:hypothetical protein